jgi:hypothetical protein
MVLSENLLFPYSSLDRLQLFGCHTFTGGKVTLSISVSFRLVELWAYRRVNYSPAVIFASISTLESAGISSSGSSTLS